MRVEIEALGPSWRAGQSEVIPSFRNSRFIRLLHSRPTVAVTSMSISWMDLYS
jgi:hypothetical protein